MKYKLFALIKATVSSIVIATEQGQKYQRGDCITPTQKMYSWYGEYAIVEAYTPVEGFTRNKVYILAFPFLGSNSAIFSSKIEQATHRVKPAFCGS